VRLYMVPFCHDVVPRRNKEGRASFFKKEAKNSPNSGSRP